jgi:hypothetical protein
MRNINILSYGAARKKKSDREDAYTDWQYVGIENGREMWEV